MGKSNGLAGPNTSKSTRSPQRIVLLAGDEQSEVKSVLAEYPGADLEKVDVKDEVPSSPMRHRACTTNRWNPDAAVHVQALEHPIGIKSRGTSH